jgi:hypothetical protein
LPLQGIEPQFLSIPAFNVKENAQIWNSKCELQ